MGPVYILFFSTIVLSSTVALGYMVPLRRHNLLPAVHAPFKIASLDSVISLNEGFFDLCCIISPCTSTGHRQVLHIVNMEGDIN